MNDPEFAAVAKCLSAFDPSQIAHVIRETIDQLYDGQRTGRYRWDQLYKTEKTHCGTLVEINLQRAFEFEDGKILDFQIAGAEVDCKFSQRHGGWMIPPEAHGHLCILLWAEDTSSPKWSCGLVRIRSEYLNSGSNRDAKSTLNEKGRAAILWLWDRHAMPANVLLQLDPLEVEALMSLKSGTQRLNQLFRVAQGRIVSRATVATVTQQDDPMKRVRENGGSRTALKGEGIIILGQYRSHVSIAADLGLPLPGPGDSLSIRVAPATRKNSWMSEIEGTYWKIATQEDPVVPAPRLPKI